MAKFFGERTIPRITRAVEWVEQQPTRVESKRRPAQDIPVYEFFIGKTDGSGITARSGTTVGSGTVTLYKLVGTTITVQQDATPADVTVTAYNLSETAVAASSYVMLMQEVISGKYFAVWEDC